MHITDARTGRRTPVRPGRAGLLRVTLDVGGPGHLFGLRDLRALLTGDVLARACEIQGLQVFTELAHPAAPADGLRVLLAAADRLGIHPPARLSPREEAVEGAEAADAAGRSAADLTITSRPPAEPGLPAEPGPPAVPLLAVGPVTGALPDADPAPDAEPLSPIAAGEPDPLALRLALLDHAPAAPLALDVDALSAAAATLARWRALVADLANEPSRPLDADLVRASIDAVHEDLDARVALRAVQAVAERADLAAGTRFETCVRLDQVLALELGRDIGRDPGRGPH
ncbi:hypothetical protein [Kitasatospora sp. LaBMicrA B282]|uniref:hypothetical protein n=1 Tax=Kitasatospora sp. LaBMicrA B282 TaxID=3420949 RepID=UPI003D103433